MSGFESDWDFPSLSKCLDDIERHFPPGEWTDVELRRPSGVVVPHRAPKYLYRGESFLFENTESSLRRLQRSGLFDVAEQECLRAVSKALQWRFQQEDYGNPEWNSDGLLQHYGIPTEVIDFSRSLEVAAAFAAFGSPGRARICILTKPIGFDAATVDYADHPWAERAIRQAAFGIRPLYCSDLKSDEARIRLGAIWAEFPVTAEDLASRRDFYSSLVDESSDPYSGMVRAEINHYVEQFGKIPQRVAQYLAGRVPMVPRLLKVTGVDYATREVITRHVAPSARLYSSSVERQKSLQYWSVAYTDSLSNFYPFENPREVGTLFAYPGTHHAADIDAPDR